MSEEFTVLTLNIHKGFSASNLRYTLEALRLALHKHECSIAFLQEVSGESKRAAKRLTGWPHSNQLEYLADHVWPHYAYGKNALSSDGHHGNAILSEVPMAAWNTLDLSQFRLSQRGLLHATLANGLELICTHLGLFAGERRAQVELLIHYVEQKIPQRAPLILAGDFNDWTLASHRRLQQALNLKEAAQHCHGRVARTFPAAWPVLSMDRLYSRGLEINRAQRLSDPLWSRLSDHCAVTASYQRLAHV